MSEGTEPRTQPGPPEGWPPATPPVPPDAAESARAGERDRGPLTAVTWSLKSAFALIVAMFALTVLAAWLADWARAADMGSTAFTLIVGAGLSGAYVLLVALVWWLARARGVRFADAVGIRAASWRVIAGGAVLATAVGRLAAGAWGAALEYFDVNLSGQDVDPSRLFPSGAVGVTMTFLVAVVLAPFAEEVVFRGVMLSAFDARFGPGFAISASSALFAGLHVAPFAIPPVFVLALVLGWLFVKTRSLTVTIIAHATFNATGLVLLYALRAAGVL